MLNKKVFREVTGYTSLLSFAVLALISIFLPNSLGPTDANSDLANVCFGFLFLACGFFSIACAFSMLSFFSINYKWNVLALMSYFLFVMAILIIGRWEWYQLALYFVFGPFTIITEWITKLPKTENKTE